ncbi:MAG: ATP-binding protein [Pyrinomonadaceae bacterium]
MKGSTILTTVPPNDFVGRSVELERMLAPSSAVPEKLAILATPSAGSSELLRQVYDRLFVQPDGFVPFYFALNGGDKKPENAARRYVAEFLRQTVAARRRDQSVVHITPSLEEVAELAPSADAGWMRALFDLYHRPVGDKPAFIKSCLAAPLRAHMAGLPIHVLIDDIHNATGVAGGDRLFRELIDVFSHVPIRVTLAGHRRFLFGRTNFRTMPLEMLSFSVAGQLVELLAARYAVTVSDQTRDLIAVQLQGNPRHIDLLLRSAADRGLQLGSFDSVERAYIDSIFGGEIARSIGHILAEVLPDANLRARVLKAIDETMSTPGEQVRPGELQALAGTDKKTLRSALRALHYREIINLGPAGIDTRETATVFRDYANSAAVLASGEKPRVQIVSDALAANIKRAPKIMARQYRQGAALGLRELMTRFDDQAVSAALLDYGVFKQRFKGIGDAEILTAIGEQNQFIQLPQVHYTAFTSGYYPQLDSLVDKERSVIASGSYGPAGADQLAWVAAEIDSKLEATRETTEFWLDRLEMAATHSNFEKYRIWLITPEGFDAEALDLMSERNAIGSSRKQVHLLANTLGRKPAESEYAAPDEYELIFPMGEDTEIIAAHAAEDVAKRFGFSPKAINQIKTAIVECCINAAEHSLSPDRKIRQKFSVDDDKMVITISNRGLRIPDAIEPKGTSSTRRGWGLKLIKSLMDQVTINDTDDGSRLTMVKYRKSP